MKKTSFNDFEFIRTLGKGAFSTVYLVRRKLNQKQYALKSIIMGKLKENELQNNVNEIRILASISHPNVIGYKEAFFNDKNKTLNIVMEYCDDGDLETKIKNMKRNKQKFEECLIWNYSLQILGGLKALHDKKILHRDLKSANIFLKKKDNQCKIGDLNVSKVMKDKYLINSQIGTPTYSSPEIWKNKPYSYKSDLWSVGCIIYEMCCLRPPFKGKNLDELCENICNGKFEKISSRYSNDLWNLIKMLLEVDVNKRVDCNKLLNSNFIKEKMDEISDIYNNDNNNNNILKFDDDDSSILETIEYKNMRDLERKIPNKKKYTIIEQNINIKKKDRNENNNYFGDETIRNDCSFDEFSISENKPINNMNKNYTNFNDNNIIFARNNKVKKIKKDIIPNIKKNIFNNSLYIHKRIKSSIIFSFDNIFLDVKLNENENEFKLKKNKSEQKINNNKLFNGYIKKDYIKYKSIDRKDIYKKDINNNNNNSNIFPQNSIVKSGLMNLKKDIAKKRSQKNVPINSYIKKPSYEPTDLHKVSNSNPKYMKQKKNITQNNSSKNMKLNGSFINKSIKHSLFESIENDKKEKSKFHNQNQKKNYETLDNCKKVKSGELSKFAGQFKKNNKLKKIGIARKTKININDIDILDRKKRSDKNVIHYINKEISNEHLTNKKIRIGTNKNINYMENNNLTINKTEISNDENSQKIIILSDKNLNNHNQDSVEKSNNLSKNKKKKSNKSNNENKVGSKIIEIDISKNTNTNNLKKTCIDLKNPFNSEHNNNNIMLNTSKDFKKTKAPNQNIVRPRFLTKGNNNIKSISNKILRPGDN